mgnify:CR=1 FL=1
MGCEQIMTFDELDDINNNLNNNQNSPPPKTNNLLIRAYAGVLTPGTNFSDTIIKSNIELNEKLRNYIPSQIKKDNSYTYNLEDDILTKSEKVNFQDEYIIAINGVNKVIRARPLFIARSRPWNFPTVAPVPAPTLPSPGSPFSAFLQAS